MIEKLERILLTSIFLFIPIQTGLHFWPDFSKISGIRVDYLSPTLYFTDILIVLLIIVALLRLYSMRFSLFTWVRGHIYQSSVLGLLFLLLLTTTYFAQSVGAAFFGSLKYLEFLALGYIISRTFTKRTIPHVYVSFAVGTLFVSVIAFFQFIEQSSLGGILYFAGERNFIASTPGIALFTMQDYSLLRPYATFAHPNILAFYLFMATTFLLLYVRTQRFSKYQIFLYGVTTIGLITLLITFSRAIIVFLLIFLGYYIWSNRSKTFQISAVVCIVLILGIYISIFSSRFLTEALLRDSFTRLDLLDIGWKIFQSNWLFGIGAKNFFVESTRYFHAFSPIFLQPVHNGYAVVLLELGIAAGVVMLIFIQKSLKNMIKIIQKTKDQSEKAWRMSVLWVFIGILLISLTDHFFVTLQQGMMMVSIIAGLSWMRK